MASLAKLGKGVILRRGGLTSPETYNAIPEVLSIDGLPNAVPEDISVYNHDSPSQYDETIPGILRLNPMTVRCNYINDAQQAALRDDIEAGVKRYYEVENPSVGGNEICRFLASVKGWKIISEPNAQQILEFVLQPSAAPVWT